MAADTGVDIDLYAEVDEIDHEVGGQHDSGGVDLYDDVLTTSAEQQAEDEALQGIVSYSGDLVAPPELPQVSGGYEYKSYTTVHPKSAASQAAQSHYERQRGKPLYVGNMTWWTTDQELTEALQECGVTDLVNIKFFENRNNGQSKGKKQKFGNKSFISTNLLSWEMASSPDTLVEINYNKLFSYFLLKTLSQIIVFIL